MDILKFGPPNGEIQTRLNDFLMQTCNCQQVTFRETEIQIWDFPKDAAPLITATLESNGYLKLEGAKLHSDVPSENFIFASKSK